jgi:hypothetical protein
MGRENVRGAVATPGSSLIASARPAERIGAVSTSTTATSRAAFVVLFLLLPLAGGVLYSSGIWSTANIRIAAKSHALVIDSSVPLEPSRPSPPTPTSTAEAVTWRTEAIRFDSNDRNAVRMTWSPIVRPPAVAALAESPVDPPRQSAGNPSESPSAEFRRVANTNGDGVYLRRTPRLRDRLVAWPEGTPLELLGATIRGEGLEWLNVRDPNGNVGWVPAQYTPE